MADSATSSVLIGIGGALIGAVSTSWHSEWYKRYRDRKALAYGLAGELKSHIDAAENAIPIFVDLAERARRSELTWFPEFDAYDSLFDKSVEKLGLLEGDIPGRLVTTYGHIKATRQRIQRIGKEFLPDRQAELASVIDRFVMNWRGVNIPAAKVLIRDLNAIGNQGLWGSLWHWPVN